MKKIYLQPETTVSFVMTQQLIADSPGVGVDQAGGEYGTGEGDEEDAAWLARPQWWVDPGL